MSFTLLTPLATLALAASASASQKLDWTPCKAGFECATAEVPLDYAAVGDKRLYYIGHSQGTFVGATYSSLFPGRVGRMVPPTTARSATPPRRIRCS